MMNTNSVENQNRKCRWGFIGSSTIGRRNWLSIFNSGNGLIKAVASRNVSRATEFVNRCQALHPFPTPPKSVAGYDAILSDPDIDAVYIPLPTGLRKEWVIKAAEHGKHVLCEKPCAVGYQDLVEMTAACQQHHVQFMDGVMFVHSDRLNRLRDTIKHPTELGEIRRITSQFCFNGGEEFEKSNIRMDYALEPAGCLGDLGWYNIRFSLCLMDNQLPVELEGRTLRAPHSIDAQVAVPLEFAGNMRFENGVESSFYCSFVTALTQWARITGTEGEIAIEDFVLPHYGRPPSFDFIYTDNDNQLCDFKLHHHRKSILADEYSGGTIDSSETKLFRRFGELVISGQPDPHWPEISLKTQLVMNGLLQSARVSKKLQLVNDNYQEN